MKLHIGPRTGLRIPASASEHVSPVFAKALRMTYREMRRDGMPALRARSLLLTAYEVGVVAGAEEHFDGVGRAARELGLEDHLPSAPAKLTVVPS